MPRMGYLSGAPRVSTAADGEAGGPRSHVLGVISAFTSLGWEVRPFIVGDRVPRWWQSSGSACALRQSPARRLAADVVRLWLSLRNGPRALAEIGTDIDLVYERFGIFQSLGRPFKKRGIAWVLETSGPFFLEADKERRSTTSARLARRLELGAYRECDVLICVTKALRDIILDEAGIEPSKVLVIPNGVDVDLFSPEAHTVRRIQRGFVVGYVGSLIGWQRLDVLIEVAGELRSRGVPISLVIIGDGPEKDSWGARARSVGMGEHVSFVGQVSRHEVPPYIAGFDVGYCGQMKLQSGSMYHSPLKLYEYMSMAKPVVASRFEDAERVVTEGETGFLFDPEDRGDLKRALIGAYEIRGRLAEIGARARESVLAEHSWVARVRDIISGTARILGWKEKPTGDFRSGGRTGGVEGPTADG